MPDEFLDAIGVAELSDRRVSIGSASLSGVACGWSDLSLLTVLE